MKFVLFLMFCFLTMNARAAVTYSVTEVSSNHTVLSSEQVLNITASQLTLSLPSCGSGNNGDAYIFKGDFQDAVYASHIVPNGTDTIDGGSNGFEIFPSQSDTFICHAADHEWKGIGVY